MFYHWTPGAIFCYETQQDCAQCPIFQHALMSEACQMPKAVRSLLDKYGPPMPDNETTDEQRLVMVVTYLRAKPYATYKDVAEHLGVHGESARRVLRMGYSQNVIQRQRKGRTSAYQYYIGG